MSDKVNAIVEKYGIDALKAGLLGIMSTVKITMGELKDGFQTQDIPMIIMKTMSDEKVNAAMKQFPEMKNEFTDLKVAEVIQLVMILLPEIASMVEKK